MICDMVLLGFAGIAACMDLINQKINNNLIYIGWFIGVLIQVSTKGSKGIVYFLISSMIPIILLFALFVFRMIGAGDIKLLSVLGGMIGFMPIIKCIAVSFVCGSVISIGVLVICGNLSQRLQYFSSYVSNFVIKSERPSYIVKGERMENIHFTVPILMGVMLYVGGIY